MPRNDRRRNSRIEDAKHIASVALVAGGLTWIAAPQVASLWTTISRSPEEVARIEASAFFPNCSAARAAGAAPIYRGEPGYRGQMDGDGDGIACEPYRHR